MHDSCLSVYCLMLLRVSEHLSFSAVVGLHPSTTEKKKEEHKSEKDCKEMLGVARTRNKKDYLIFILELMFSPFTATYQVDAKDVGDDKT